MAFSDTELKALFCRAGHLYSGSHLDELEFSEEGVKTDYFFPPSREIPYELITPKPEDSQIGPAGFDLRVGTRIACSDILRQHITPEKFEKMNPVRLPPGKNISLKCDADGRRVYYIASLEQTRLPRNLEIIIDAKSTTGRVGCMCHSVGSTFLGEAVIAVQPFAFPIKITSGKTRLAQAIIRYKDTPFINFNELKKNNKKILLFRNRKNVLGEMLTPLGLGVNFSTAFVYRAKKCDEPIDMDLEGVLDWTKYFDRIEGNSIIVMDEKTLYLFGTQEEIKLGEIYGRLSRESDLSGTGLWSHFAGHIQPFFEGSITLECFSSCKREITKGDLAGVILFDRVKGEIGRHYNGAYQNQEAPRLARMFKQD